MLNALIGIVMNMLAALGLVAAPAAVAPGAPLASSSPTVATTEVRVQTQEGQTGQTAPAHTAAASSDTAAASLPNGSAWLANLPLGDGKYVTSGAKKGYIYICHIATGGKGAQGSATWIHGSTWTPSEKVSVSGNVAWPSAAYSMRLSGSSRIITSNGLPTDHDSGTFPIQRSDPAFQFDGNPNSIKPQSDDFTLPAYPSAAASPNCIFGQVGIMTDGVVLFDGFDAEYRDAVAHETQDAWEAHPDQAGVYHYHGFESGYVKDAVSKVVGYAFDGYPITGSLLPNGNYLHTADLDECHGITSAIELDGKTVTTYHYVLTQDFPYSVSCYHGKSYEPKPGQGSQTGGVTRTAGAQQSQSGPPQAAVNACAGKSTNAPCSFSTPNGTISGTCKTPPSSSSLACVPN